MCIYILHIYVYIYITYICVYILHIYVYIYIYYIHSLYNRTRPTCNIADFEEKKL